MEELGVTYTAGKPGDTYVLRNGRLSLFPASPMALVRSSLLSPVEKLELLGLFARLPRIGSGAFANVSVEDWLESVARGTELRGLLASIARTFAYSSALDLVSAEVFIDKSSGRSILRCTISTEGGRLLSTACIASQSSTARASGAGCMSRRSSTLEIRCWVSALPTATWLRVQRSFLPPIHPTRPNSSNPAGVVPR